MQTSCPHCGQSYDVSAEMLGSQVKCSTCSKAFNLPTAAAPSDSPAVDPNAPVEVACPHCDSRFQAPPQLVGTSANCHTCHQTFVIEKAETDFSLAPAEDDRDPFSGLAGSDPLGASSPSTSLGSGPLGAGGASSFPTSSSSGSADLSGLWIGIAKILGGVLMGVFGVVATTASYESAEEGGTYTAYYGLVIGGIALVGYGIRDIYLCFAGD